jgi:hypothetical protein
VNKKKESKIQRMHASARPPGQSGPRRKKAKANPGTRPAPRLFPKQTIKQVVSKCGMYSQEQKKKKVEHS